MLGLGLQLCKKKDFGAGVSLLILRKFSKQPFYKTPVDGCVNLMKKSVTEATPRTCYEKL